jgi:hypothetical protein
MKGAARRIRACTIDRGRSMEKCGKVILFDPCRKGEKAKLSGRQELGEIEGTLVG